MTPTVLIIDDEPSVAGALRRCLMRDGYSVQVASTGAQALRLATDERFDLVVCDYALPDTDGLALLAQLTALQPNAVRLLVTGSGADVHELKPALDALVYRLVAKPWDDLDLRQTVRRALEHQALLERYQSLERELRGGARQATAGAELPQ